MRITSGSVYRPLLFGNGKPSPAFLEQVEGEVIAKLKAAGFQDANGYCMRERGTGKPLRREPLIINVFPGLESNAANALKQEQAFSPHASEPNAVIYRGVTIKISSAYV